MAINLFDDIDNSARGFVGAGGQLNFYDETLKKYVLFIPLETLPSVVGSPNTVDNDVTTSATVGKIESKTSLDNKDLTFLWNRDDLMRLEALKGKTLSFLVSYADGTGWKFRASFTYRNDDAGASDKVTGTLTLIPADSEPSPVTDTYDLLAKSCIFVGEGLDADTILTSAEKTKTFPLTSKVEGVTYNVESLNSAITVTQANGVLTITTTATTNTSGIVKVTASKAGFGSWFVTTRVIFQA